MMKNNTMMIRPKTLEKGDKIAIISPAGAVEEEELRHTISLIEERGYIPVLGQNALGNYEHGYLYSGTESERIADINWAIQDEEIKAIWASRGGYGCQHLLYELDIKSFQKNPKWYIGYSDNTVLQSYFFKKKIASIHGQTIKTSSFGVSEQSYAEVFNILEGHLPVYEIERYVLNRTGEAMGNLVGGNLAMIYALLGTRYSVKFRNNILFIEDIGENFYALDRMLTSLELAEVFDEISGLIIGGMINMGNEKDNPHYDESFDPKAYQLIEEKIRKYHFPVAFGFPNGHIYHNLPLIIGSTVHLKVDEKVHLQTLNI